MKKQVKDLDQTHTKNSLVWCGQAITLYMELEGCRGIGSGKIKVIVWFMKNIASLDGYSLRGITKDLGLGKKTCSTAQASASPSVTNTVRCLMEIGVLEKDGSTYRANIEEGEIKRKKYYWVGRAFMSLIRNTGRSNAHSVGSKKIRILVWLYENKQSLPGSIRKLNFEMGIVKQRNIASVTTSTLIPLLVEEGLLRKLIKRNGESYYKIIE